MIAILVKIVHFIVCIGLIVIVLLQADKGEGLAGAFGSGASSTVFGERGGGGIMAKITTWMAVIFMITSLLISIYLPQWTKESGESGFSNRSKPPVETSMPIKSPFGEAVPTPAPQPVEQPAAPTGK